jgi:hypothetical protein
MMRPLVSIALLAALACSAHAAEPPSVVSGPVRVIDGDTIVLTNTNIHVRLNGVDAPEVVHPGYDHDDDFGSEARSEMRRIIGDPVVRCELNGERSYERWVGVCYLPTEPTSAPKSSAAGWRSTADAGRSGATARSSLPGSETSSARNPTAAHDGRRPHRPIGFLTEPAWRELAADWHARANESHPARLGSFQREPR